MALLSIFARLGAAGALALATLAPVAAADDRGRGDRGGYHDRGDRGHRGDRHHGRRGDWDRGRHHGNRGWDRGRDHRRGDWHRGRDYRRGDHHHRGRDYYRPRVVNRYYYSTPRYFHPRPGISFHYNSGYHHPRYTIGGYYDYGPRTIVIRDYNRYGLYAPPHGHHWVRDPYSGDAVLASVATGAIIGLAIGILAQ